MSRFLGSFRRLKKRVEKARAGRLDLGKAMREYALYGTVPKNPALKAELEMFYDMAWRMAATVPQRVTEPWEGETVH